MNKYNSWGKILGLGAALGVGIPAALHLGTDPVSAADIESYQGIADDILGKGTTVSTAGKGGKLKEFAKILDPAHYNPMDKSIMINRKSLPMFLHEVGHAQNAKMFGKYAIPAAVVQRKVAPMAGDMAAYFLNKSTNPALQKLVPHASVAGRVPTIVGEAVASGRALNNLRKLKGMKAAIKGAVPLGTALGSYVGNAVLAGQLAKKMMGR